MLLSGIIFILIGYFLLFSVPADATFERMLLQAIAGMGMSFVGAVLCMIYIYKPKIADRNLFSGDFVILSSAKDLQPFHQTGFSIRDSSGH